MPTAMKTWLWEQLLILASVRFFSRGLEFIFDRDDRQYQGQQSSRHRFCFQVGLTQSLVL